MFDVRSKEYDVAAREALQYSTGIFPDSCAVLNTMQRYYNPRYGCPTLSISHRLFCIFTQKSQKTQKYFFSMNLFDYAVFL